MKDDEGVANVVGAVLMMSIMVITIVMVQVSFVPVWNQEEENTHLSQVLNEFAQLKSTTDHAVTNGTSSAIAHVITGSHDGGQNFLVRPGIPGQVQFEPGEESAKIVSPAFTVISKDGRTSAILNERWETSNGTNDVQGIGELEHLRLRLTAVNGSLEFKKNGFVRMEMQDSAGEFAGSFMVYTPEKQKEDVWIRIRDATGYTVIDQEYASDVKFKEHGQFWVNLLDPGWPFREVLDSIEGSYSIHMSYDFPDIDENKWPRVDYSIAYRQASTLTGQSVLLGTAGAGKTVYNYTEPVGGGRIVFDTGYQHADATHVVFENGAVIVEQANGAAIAVNPDFIVDKVDNIIVVTATIPRLHGVSDSGSQAGAMTITTRALGNHDVVGTTTEWTLELDTAYPQAWAGYFDRVMGSASLIPGTDYQVQVGPDYVHLTITGDPANGALHDVQVTAAFPVYGVQVVV